MGDPLQMLQERENEVRSLQKRYSTAAQQMQREEEQLVKGKEDLHRERRELEAQRAEVEAMKRDTLRDIEQRTRSSEAKTAAEISEAYAVARRRPMTTTGACSSFR